MLKSISQKNKSSLISIIIPFRNTKIRQFIGLIENIKHLDLDRVEVIFINDHSDNEQSYLDILKQIEGCRYYSLTHKKGVSAARNEGIKNATGEYISFVDSDDLINPIVFNSFVKRVLDKDIYIFEEGVFLDGEKPLIDEHSKIVEETNIDKTILLDMFINYKIYSKYKTSFSMRSVYCKFYKKETITHLFDEELSFYEDSLFVANYINDHKTIDGSIIDSVLYYYRIDFDSSSRRFNKLYNELYQKYFDHYSEAFKNDKRYMLPISFDSLSTVLPVKATQAFKKMHLRYAMKLIKSDWAKQSASSLIECKDDIDDMTLGITNRINKKHYVSCIFYILCNRMIKSIKIRTNKVFKRGK